MSNHESLYRGDEYLEAVNNAPDILICGCGALGSNLAETLVRHGFTKVDILDMDKVEKSNIGTQTYTEADVGLSKTNALSNLLFSINNKYTGGSVNKKLEKKNLKKHTKDYGLVVDCFDNPEARTLLHSLKDPVIHAGVYEDYGEVVWNERYKVPEKAEGVDVCDYPLARNIIMLTVTVLAEEILCYFIDTKHVQTDWQITLKDKQIRKYV